MTDFEGLLAALPQHDVAFIVVGGAAAIAHGSSKELAPNAIELHVFGIRCLCLSLDQLIRAKRAAGRPKDLEALAELEAIREEG